MEDLLANFIIAGAEAPPSGPGQGGAPGFSFIQCLMPLAILGIFYALLIRPQRQQQKAHAEMVSNIKKGTRVVAAGMVGVITSVKQTSIMLKTGDSRVELDRNAIDRVLDEEEDDEEDEDEPPAEKKKSAKKKKKKDGSQD